MIITDVKTYVLKLDFKLKLGSMPAFNVTGLYLNLKTDEGIEGWALSHWNLSNMGQKNLIDESLRYQISAHEKRSFYGRRYFQYRIS
ncbi:MAG: hypothetical protein P8Y23_17485 [Candidatus Lokiarchaeota archaeon]